MDLHPANPRELAFAIHYALRYGLDGKRLGKTPMDPQALADHILLHLARSNYVVMQGTPLRAHSSTDLGLRGIP